MLRSQYVRVAVCAAAILLSLGAGSHSYANAISGDNSLRVESFDVDPGWTAVGNGINGNDFGYQTTGNAGGSPGEAGGAFTRSAFAMYYGDTHLGGFLSLDDAITATGKLDFTTESSPDFGRSFMIGHFSTTGPAKIGIAFTDNSVGGLFWQARVVLNSGTVVLPFGPLPFDPNIDRDWAYAWDPLGGIEGFGRFEASLSGPGGGFFGFDLSESQRLVGSTLDAFGLSGNPAGNSDPAQSGAVFVDDVAYTVATVPEPDTPVDPDNFPVGTVLTNAFEGVTLSVTGRPDAEVISIDGYNDGLGRNVATTGSSIFGYTPIPIAPITNGQVWGDVTYGNLRADFDVATAFVQIDLVFGDDGIGVLRAYDAIDNLLEEVVAYGDGRGPRMCPPFCLPVVTASVTRASADIAYVVAGGQGGEPNMLDNLRYNSTAPPPETVTIDIKPRSDRNCININDHGVIPVATFGSADFNVEHIDQTTLLFAGLDVRETKKGRLRCRLKDINIDGYWDLICRFEDDVAKWMPDSDDQATLTGRLLELFGGSAFQGTDSFCLKRRKDAEELEEPIEPEEAIESQPTTEEDNLNPLPWWAW